MHNLLINRVSEFIESKNMSPRAFAIKIGFNYSTLNNYLSGRRTNIDAELLVKIASSFGDIDYEWILTGRKNQNKENLESKIEVLNKLLESKNKTIDSQRETINSYEETISNFVSRNNRTSSDRSVENAI